MTQGWGGARSGAGRKRDAAPDPVLPAALDHTARWYCVRTDYSCERLAATEIGMAGFEVFSPTLFRPGGPPYRDGFGTVRPARPDSLAPLFPRYLFVRFARTDPVWRAIPDMAGVDRLLSNGPESPTAMPDQAIEIVKSLTSANGCVYPPDRQALAAGRASRPIPIGAAVRLVDGPLAEQNLVGICDWSDARRARLVLQILGGEVKLTLPLGQVEAIEAP